ncbi:VOC family protein [Lentibacillus saliphilus]|uniref:VOC family protein n=1 Tax=Lentibacillus saliphilus TaxID=2737028 RepID=UPI001C30EB79|nr:VOC family protein [Lentibacillus saliphilus]
MKFPDFSAVQVRVARPTDQLNEVVKFYEQGFGLKRLAEFSGHDGYDGVILGIPDVQYHLEFTQHIEGSPCPAPTTDNLLVFYMPDGNKVDKIADRLRRMGYGEVEPENGYWKEKGKTIEDPDGWRIVLMNTEGI